MAIKSAYVVAVLVGLALWTTTALLTGRREAWDSSLYWSLAYPMGVAAAGVLGYVAPHRGAWRLGLAMTTAQAATLALTARSFGLLPLGLVLFAILSIPPAGLATIASLAAQRRRERP